jgi:hypothetical protein
MKHTTLFFIAMLSTASILFASAMVLAFRNSPWWGWFLFAGLSLCILAIVEENRRH